MHIKADQTSTHKATMIFLFKLNHSVETYLTLVHVPVFL
jgi:hypothetical protein